MANNPPNRNSTGLKAFATVAALIAIIGTLYTTYARGIHPLEQRIDFMSRQVTTLEEKISNLNNSVTEYQINSASTNAAHNERLRALERAVYKSVNKSKLERDQNKNLEK